MIKYSLADGIMGKQVYDLHDMEITQILSADN